MCVTARNEGKVAGIYLLVAIKMEENINVSKNTNWMLIVGLILLAIAIGLIVVGLKNNTQGKAFFNVSRLLALLSVAGIWYFGNILTKNTDLKISQNEKDNSALSLELEGQKSETASAKKKTEEVRLEVESAKEEVQKSKLETQKVALEVAKANAEAEKAKLERDHLRIKTINLQKETDRIKSIRIIANILIQDDNTYDKGGQAFNMAIENAKLDLINTNGQLIHHFKPNSTLNYGRSSDGRAQFINEYLSSNINLINTKPISILNSVGFIDLTIKPQIDALTTEDKINQTDKAQIQILVFINGVESLNFTNTEDNIGNLLKLDKYRMKVDDVFNKIEKSHKLAIGVKE